MNWRGAARYALRAQPHKWDVALRTSFRAALFLASCGTVGSQKVDCDGLEPLASRRVMTGRPSSTALSPSGLSSRQSFLSLSFGRSRRRRKNLNPPVEDVQPERSLSASACQSSDPPQTQTATGEPWIGYGNQNTEHRAAGASMSSTAAMMSRLSRQQAELKTPQGTVFSNAAVCCRVTTCLGHWKACSAAFMRPASPAARPCGPGRTARQQRLVGSVGSGTLLIQPLVRVPRWHVDGSHLGRLEATSRWRPNLYQACRCLRAGGIGQSTSRERGYSRGVRRLLQWMRRRSFRGFHVHVHHMCLRPAAGFR